MNWTWRLQARCKYRPVARSSRSSLVLHAEQLEDRSVPAVATVNFNPFPGFSGQVNVASGDVNGDGVPDIITAEGAGTGGQSEVRIFDGASARQGKVVLLADFFPYSNAAGASQTPGFAGGVNVAAADFNGDGFAELITSPGPGGQGHVKVFNFHDPATGQFLGSNPILETSFVAYPGFNGNISVAALNRVGGLPPLLVTASGAGTTQADIRVFANPFAIGSVPVGTFVPPVAQTFVFPGYLGGVSIATGQTTANANDTLFISPNVGNSVIAPYNLFSGSNGLVLTPGLPFQTGFVSPTDVRIGTADILGNGLDQVLASSVTPTGATPIEVFSFINGVPSPQAPLTNFQGFGLFGDEWVASSAFTNPTPSSTIPGTTPALSTTGLTGFGTTGLTGFGAASLLAGFTATPGLTGSSVTPGVTPFGSSGFNVSPGIIPIGSSLSAITPIQTTGSTAVMTSPITPSASMTAGTPTSGTVF